VSVKRAAIRRDTQGLKAGEAIVELMEFST
jgi:hypothetical protein